MKPNTRMQRASALIVFTAALQCGNLAMAQSRTVDQHQAADLDGAVEIENVAGRVEVTGWDRAEVAVTGSIGPAVERVDVNSSAGHTTVRVVIAEHSHRNDVAAELVVHIPRKSRLEVGVVSAELTTRELQGEQRLQSVSGDIDATLAQEAQISSVSGSIKLAAGKGPLEVNSVSGDVTVKGATGEIRVGTVSGGVDLAMDGITRAHFQTVSGKIKTSGALASGAQVDAQSVSGGMHFILTGAAEFDLESFSGSIDNCFGPKAERAGYGPGTHLTFRQGEGTAHVRLGTHSGTIHLCDHL